MNVEKEIERQLSILKRGVEDLISEEELRKKIKKSIETGKPLKVKFGIDPTGNSIHIGHAVPIRKLKQFQDLGHTVQFLIGTYTAKIGDPTGKSETRKVLSDDEINENIKGYLEQVGKILDIDKTEIRYNGEWLSKLTMEEILNLTSQFTVSQMISREDFSKRLKENKPVSLVEFMYPILQGYDSVALECDVELGATEQKFNLLRGRDLQKYFNQEQQVCMMMPILEGTDGVNKMSKSLNNYIGITEAPNDMFGKVMSISDELMINYYEMATEIPLEDIRKMEEDIKSGVLHPMEAKKRLGEEIVKLYHNEESAKAARDYFEKMFSKKDIPDDIPEIKVEENEMAVIDLIFEKIKFGKSKSEARRLIKGNGFRINGEVFNDINGTIKMMDGMILKAGKKKIVKIIK
ncbi:tyrosine--tRNA ligase [Haliovirga abyssi]|uniref:Tyrosine--tRNA ligase n=1 Tax=Haliovirga abyssi TaxID=2996794 RepID=A0AAU9D941_9FUSO|nr:tyrosine--tRNA ligase [Haliovirga abyssi]BDU49795.1 tyrosine--tRNA ligase [Haliovirga abyssi]